MSKLLATLVAEHDHIRRVLGALHDYAAFHALADPDARATIARFVCYLREYVDGLHHHKEEDLLFPAMERAGLPRAAGPLACMHADHDAGRRHVATLAAIARGSGPLGADELVALGDAVLGYVRLLGSHIGKENQMLYPLALQLVSAAALGVLDDQIARADPAEQPRLEALGDELIDRHAAAGARPASATRT